MSLSLATRSSWAVASLICATEPGVEPTSSDHRVCTESTTHTAGLSCSSARTSDSVCVSGRRRSRLASPPSRTLRSLTCDDDSSPEMSRAEIAARLHAQQGLQQKGALAHAGLAAHQHHRAGHQTSAEYPVQLGEPGVDAHLRTGVYVGQVDRSARRRRRRRCAAGSGASRGHLFDYGVPLAAARAAPQPARRLIPAFLAGEGATASCH